MHERVYHPETCEPFDVTSNKATDLVLNHGWTRTPWVQVSEPEMLPVREPAPVSEPARGRGRRRRAVEEAPIEHFHGPAPFVLEDEPAAENWRH